MASRHHQHQLPAAQQQRAAAPQMAKQQQQHHQHQQKPTGGAAADGNKNRRALGDIGNLVNAPRVANGKPLPQVSRPITRSFGAQLLRNAQAAQAGHKGAGGAAVAKPRQQPLQQHQQHHKAPVVPPKPTNATTEGDAEVMEISADDFPKNPPCNSARRHRKKHAAAALSAVLTARSKAACGIVDNDGKKKAKKKSATGEEEAAEKDPDSLPLPDIDSADAGDQLAVSEYVEDIYSFYKQAENWSRPGDYMANQSEINAKMRAILADWLVEVHHKFELMPETLYLTLHVVDRYLASVPVVRRELQLVGVAAMLIACKYEEIWAPEVHDFISISDRAYDREQILGMEKQILNRLQWSLTLPTPYVFLVRFIKASANTETEPEDDAAAELEHMTFYLAELGMIQYQASIAYAPSMLAAAAVYLARRTFGRKPCWTETLRRHTGYTETQLHDCAVLLARYHSGAAEGKLRAVYRKYLSHRRGVVSAKPPCREFLEQAGAAEAGKGSSS